MLPTTTSKFQQGEMMILFFLHTYFHVFSSYSVYVFIFTILHVQHHNTNKVWASQTHLTWATATVSILSLLQMYTVLNLISFYKFSSSMEPRTNVTQRCHDLSLITVCSMIAHFWIITFCAFAFPAGFLSDFSMYLRLWWCRVSLNSKHFIPKVRTTFTQFVCQRFC